MKGLVEDRHMHTTDMLMSKEQALALVYIEKDHMKFFAIKDLSELSELSKGMEYLPTELRHLLVKELVTVAVHGNIGKEVDLVVGVQLFEPVHGWNLPLLTCIF